MPKQLLFIQGAGEGAHSADAKLVENLRSALGAEYKIAFPTMPNEFDADYAEWRLKIGNELAGIPEPVILVAHSVGASILLKYLSGITVQKRLEGIFLIATPFWGGNGWHYEGYKKLELPADLEARLPKKVPVFLYHCQDDNTVPYEHMTQYARLLPHATERRLVEGGHMFNNDLSLVVKDIKNVESG